MQGTIGESLSPRTWKPRLRRPSRKKLEFSRMAVSFCLPRSPPSLPRMMLIAAMICRQAGGEMEAEQREPEDEAFR